MTLHLLSPDLAQGSVPTSSRRPFPRHLDLGEKVTAGGEDCPCCGNCTPRAVMGQGLRASALTASVAGFWAFYTLGPRCITLQGDDYQPSSPSTALGQLLNSWCLSFLICKMGSISLPDEFPAVTERQVVVLRPLMLWVLRAASRPLCALSCPRVRDAFQDRGLGVVRG